MTNDQGPKANEVFSFKFSVFSGKEGKKHLSPYPLPTPLARGEGEDCATADSDAAQTWYMAKFHKSLQTVGQLNVYFTGLFTDVEGGVPGRSLNGGYSKLYHEWWVPRPNTLGTPSASDYFPALSGTYTKGVNPANTVGWPRKTSDTSVSLSPIISDLAEAGDAIVDDVSKDVPPQAHMYGGSLNSVNVGYADGHVELHNRNAIQWQYTAESFIFY